MIRARSQAGVTLIELLISASIIGVLALVISQFFVYRLIDYTRNNTQLILQTNTRQAVETITRDIKAAQIVQDNNTWPDPNSPSGQYGWTSTSGRLVLAVPAQDNNGDLLYADYLQNTLHTNDVVYYVDGTTQILYKRIIANPVSGNAAVTTCPPELATATCPADAKIVEDVASLTLAYYIHSTSVTATPSSASSVDVTLSQSRTRFGRTYHSIVDSRSTMRNR